MKIFLLLLLVQLSIFGRGILQNQWQQTDSLFGGHIPALTTTGNNIFARTRGGGIFLSTNNGLSWNAVNLPSGVYFYQLRAGDFVQTKKMILLK